MKEEEAILQPEAQIQSAVRPEATSQVSEPTASFDASRAERWLSEDSRRLYCHYPRVRYTAILKAD